jgi:hypothetical protein
MEILNSTVDDADEILRLCKLSKKSKNVKRLNACLNLNRKSIISNIVEKRLWKIVIDNQIAFVFTILLNHSYNCEIITSPYPATIFPVAINPAFNESSFIDIIGKLVKKYEAENVCDMARPNKKLSTQT